MIGRSGNGNAPGGRGRKVSPLAVVVLGPQPFLFFVAGCAGKTCLMAPWFPWKPLVLDARHRCTPAPIAPFSTWPPLTSVSNPCSRALPTKIRQMLANCFLRGWSRSSPKRHPPTRGPLFTRFFARSKCCPRPSELSRWQKCGHGQALGKLSLEGRQTDWLGRLGDVQSSCFRSTVGR